MMNILDKDGVKTLWEAQKRNFLDKNGDSELSSEMIDYLGLDSGKTWTFKDILHLALNPGGITFPFSTEVSDS